MNFSDSFSTESPAIAARKAEILILGSIVSAECEEIGIDGGGCGGKQKLAVISNVDHSDMLDCICE